MDSSQSREAGRDSAMKKLIKHGVKIVLESNGSPTALVVILIKKPILILLDQWAPDEEETKK